MKKTIQRIVGTMGLKVVKKRPKPVLPIELNAEEKALFNYVYDNELSMVAPEGMFATLLACKYVIDQNIDGDFVECGVWRGGNAILAAGMFKLHGVKKKVYLFDTFGGMTAPTESDLRVSDGQVAEVKFAENQRDGFNEWAYCSLDDVTENFKKRDLLSDDVIMIQGDVLETLSNKASLPERISVLRLDTDWYESTKYELEVLYPLLSVGGLLAVDDYGAWAGATKATDEYFDKNGNRPFLNYINTGIRMGVKCEQAS